MKKLFALLLALIIVLGLMAGCAEEQTPTEPKNTEASVTETDYAASTVILYTANVRGKVAVYPQIAAAKAAYEAKGATTILVDAGNYLQGTAEANTDRGLTIYNLMDAAGYDVAAMGEYEFVYGDATTGYIYHSNLTKYYTQAELLNGAEELEYQKNAPWAEEKVMDTRAAKTAASFKVICSNLTAGSDASGYYAFDANAVVGETLKVGFVSEVSEEVATFVQDGFLNGYAFGTADAPACDITVALGGGTGDIVIAAEPDGAMTVGAYVINNATKEITEETVDMTDSDTEIAALVSAIEPAKVVGTSTVTLNGADSVNWNGESNLGDLTADALLWYAQNKVEGLKELPVVAIQNGGNCDNFIYTGDITEVDLLKALPFSPMGIGVAYVSGAELLQTLEASTQTENCPGWAQVAGLTYTVNTENAYDADEAYGDWFMHKEVKRVTINTVNGEAFDPEATYAVIADNFLMNGNDTYYTLGAIKEAGENYVELSTFGGLKTRDVVAMYIEEVLGGNIGDSYAQPQGRITVQ